MPKERKSSPDEDAVKIRLDALIRLVLESMYANKSMPFDQATAARALKSVGLSPTDIAHIMGKKSAQDVSPYLYSKKKRVGTRKR